MELDRRSSHQSKRIFPLLFYCKFNYTNIIKRKRFFFKFYDCEFVLYHYFIITLFFFHAKKVFVSNFNEVEGKLIFRWSILFPYQRIQRIWLLNLKINTFWHSTTLFLFIIFSILSLGYIIKHYYYFRYDVCLVPSKTKNFAWTNIVFRECLYQ